MTKDFQAFRRFKTVGIACCALLLGAAIGSRSMLAQDTPPPPPPDGAQQGPPPGGRGTPEMRAHRELERLTKVLSLTEDQAAQVKAVLDDEQKQMEASRDSDSGDPRARMMAIRQAGNTKIRALLTDQQKTKFDAIQSQQRQRGGPGGPPPPPPSL